MVEKFKSHLFIAALTIVLNHLSKSSLLLYVGIVAIATCKSIVNAFQLSNFDVFISNDSAILNILGVHY